MAEEEQRFRRSREEALLARAAARVAEERAVRAAEMRQQGRAAMTGGPTEGQAAERDHVAEYEARLRARSRPKTEEEKRRARHNEMLRQIEQADAMDERLARKNQAARREREGLE